MSDQQENITIAVKETGIDTVEQALIALGLTAEAAAERLASGFVRSSQTATTATNAINILTQAEQAGIGSTDALEAAIARMTAGELNAAVRGQTLTRAVTDFGAAAIQAKLGAADLAAAEDKVAASAEKAAGSVDKASKSSKGFSDNLTGLKGIIEGAAVYFSFSAFEKASDAFTTIDNKLKQVTTSTSDYNTAYSSLLETSNKTQSSFKDNAGLFFGLSLATKEAKVSITDLTTVVDSIAASGYASGASTDQMSRSIRELTEVFAKGGSAGRQFQSIMMNTPGIMKTLEVGSGLTREELLKLVNASATAGTAVDDFGAKTAKAALNDDKAALSASTHAHAVSLLSQQHKAASDAITALGQKAGTTYDQMAAARQKLANVDAQANLEQQKQYVQEDAAAAASAVAHQKAAKATAQAQGDLTTNLVKWFIAGDKSANELAVAMNGTIHGAMTVLNNDWVDYIGKVDQATGANRVIIASIVLIASNLQVVIPIVAAFVAAFALDAVITTIKSLRAELLLLGTAIEKINIASWLNPWTIGFAVLALAVAGIITYFDGWSTILKDIQVVWTGVWTAIKIGIQSALDTLKPFWDFVANQLSLAWTSLQATIVSCFGQSASAGEIFTGVMEIIVVVVKDIVLGVGILVTTATLGFAAIVTSVDFVINVVKGIVTALKSVYDFFSYLTTSVTNWLNSWIDKFLVIIGLAKQLPSTTPTTGANPGFAPAGARDGTDFRVGNAGGGTDSQLLQMMVSPGERVIVQTPAQQDETAGLPHFRNGGAVSVGVDGGLSGINVAYIPSTNSSVTGYTPVIQQAVQQALAPQTTVTKPSNPSVNAGSPGTPDVIDQIISAMSIFTTGPLTYGRPIDALKYITRDPVARYGVPDWLDNVLTHGMSVTAYYKGIGRGDISGGPMGANENSDVQKGYDYLRAMQAHSGESLGGGWGSSIRAPFFGATEQQQLNADLAAGAIPWEHDPLNPAIALSKLPITINFTTNPSPSSSNTPQGSQQPTVPGYASTQTSQANNGHQAPIQSWNGSGASDAAATFQSSSNYSSASNWTTGRVGYQGTGPNGFRDGGDFMVPGTSGVDSQLIGMLVSPGENVSVKTPGQQAAANNNGGSAPHYTFNSTYNIQSPDVGGFRRSAAQIDQEQSQRLKRINNRSRG